MFAVAYIPVYFTLPKNSCPIYGLNQQKFKIYIHRKNIYCTIIIFYNTIHPFCVNSQKISKLLVKNTIMQSITCVQCEHNCFCF